MPYTLLDYAAVETTERSLRAETGRRQSDRVIAYHAGYPVEFVGLALQFCARLRSIPATREARGLPDTCEASRA